MAQRCDLCGKGPVVGHQISHAHNVTKRRWLPNLVSIRAVVAGRTRRVRVCTRCLRAGRVVKAGGQPAAGKGPFPAARSSMRTGPELATPRPH